MNKTKLIGGIACLAAGALLAVLTFVLPEDKMVFMIGDANVPIVPAIVLIIIGIVLLATAREGERTTVSASPQATQPVPITDPDKEALNKRLEGAAWGLFLIMLGGFSFVPSEQVPKGAWSVGIGLIMLGLNAARYYVGLKLSGFTTFLGVLALAGGIAQLLGFYEAEGALFLIILGAYFILKPWFDRNQIFGKPAGG